MPFAPEHVADEEPLHRRIHRSWLKEDGSISSAAFNDDRLSVDRGRYCTPEQSLSAYGGFGLAAILASYARSEGQEVISDVYDLFTLAHCLVIGKKPKAMRRRLATAASWVVRFGPEAAAEGSQVN